jgi:tetratricopeptide (TPR) repeat protein
MDRILGTLAWVYEGHQIIHRDLKPENILLDSEGRAFVADWGIARIQQEQSPTSCRESKHPLSLSNNFTQTGQFIGTVTYSAPEQLIGSRSIDHRADIYSLGCLMYEWETGRPPFTGATAEEIAYQHLERPVSKLGGLFKRTVFGVEKVIVKCLAKKPEDRFQLYSEFRSALLGCARTRSVSVAIYQPRKRYEVPLIGGQAIRQGFPDAILGAKLSNRPLQDDGAFVKQYSVVKYRDLEPFLREARVLSGVGEWKKASEIYARLFVPELIRSLPDEPFYQQITVNYANCLTNLSRPKEATAVLRTISSANSKPAEYFVNLSLALLQLGAAADAEQIAREGLTHFPADTGILGNLTIGLCGQEKYEEAKPIAETCLALSRDVHSLEQLAQIEMSVGKQKQATDWPKAVEHFARATVLLNETKDRNPRYLPTRFNLARTLLWLGNATEAMQELEEISGVGLNRAWAEPWARTMAECLQAQGSSQCWKFCDKWLKEFPDNINLQRARAEAMMELCIDHLVQGRRGIEPDCIEFFTAIIQDTKNRQLTDFVNFARVAEWAVEEPHIAYGLLDEAEKVQPGSWQVAFYRAHFLHRSEQDKSALDYAQRACSKAPWRAECWNLISVIQRVLGLSKEAIQSEARARQVCAVRDRLAKQTQRPMT